MDPIARLDQDLMARGGVRVRRDGAILSVALARPDARNAQTPSTWQALAAVGEAVSASDVMAVVLSGDGPSFSAGLDRRMFTLDGIPGETSIIGLARSDDAQLDAWIAEAQRGFTWWRDVRPITIALVDGHAIGAGFQLALACDILLARPGALFAMRESSYGLVPDLAGTSPLVRAIGYSRALEICATGRMVTAEEGYQLGFVTRLVDDQAVADILQSLASVPAGVIDALRPLLAGAESLSRPEQQAAERSAQAGRLRALLATMGG